MTQRYPFNDDLLLSQEDRAKAQIMWPNVAFAFQNDDLKGAFEALNDKAVSSKARARHWGVTAVGLVWASLLAASAEPLYAHSPLKNLAIGIAAIAGIAGAVIGAAGVMFAESKRRWLERRFLTERLRQFNFQSVIFLADEILRAAETGDHTEFRQRREQCLTTFDTNVIARVSASYESTVEHTDEEKSPWLFEDGLPSKHLNGPHLDELLDAYATLRFRRQIDFVNHKLSRDRHMFSPFPAEQAARFGIAALMCVVGLVALHALVAWGAFKGASHDVMLVGQIAAMWLAITALALRTLEEGLQPHRETERYRAYRAATKRAQRAFENARTAKEKLTSMRDMERLSFDEMLSFLESNQEAKFVM